MLIVDAFNVVRAQWALPREHRGRDIRGLIDWIGVSRFAGRRLRVIVDGRPSPEWVSHGVATTHAGLTWSRVGHTEVVFSGKGREADDVIEDILSRTRGIEMTMVSSDRRLIAAARAVGAQQIGNGAFLKMLLADHLRETTTLRPAFAEDVPLDRLSIAHWMHEFGFEVPKDKPTEPVESEPRPAPEPVSEPPPPDPARFGSQLSIPEPAAPAPVPQPSPSPEPQGEGMEHEPLDPLLREAFEEWTERFHISDLDMNTWIDGVDPL